MGTRLKGHRQSQLQLLAAAGAFSSAQAVAVSFDRDYRPGTLSAMVGEGLVEQACLPFRGDGKRRVSHYWVTPLGRETLGKALSQ